MYGANFWTRRPISNPTVPASASRAAMTARIVSTSPRSLPGWLSKAALRPVYERLRAAAASLGPDVEVVIQKTGVSFRRRKQFGLVQAPSAKRVTLGLNLADAPADPRVVATPGAMCGYRVDLADEASVDDAVRGWLAEAYDRAG